jgi:hypothetical protein
MPAKFKANLNLDDPEEVESFINTHGTLKGRGLANTLGFTGKGAVTAANALSNYAWNKSTAISCRLRGAIPAAMGYERICDSIYREDISSKIECW